MRNNVLFNLLALINGETTFLAANPFPTRTRWHTVAQAEDTFYVVGGYNGSFAIGAFDTVYRYK